MRTGYFWQDLDCEIKASKDRAMEHYSSLRANSPDDDRKLNLRHESAHSVDFQI